VVKKEGPKKRCLKGRKCKKLKKEKQKKKKKKKKKKIKNNHHITVPHVSGASMSDAGLNCRGAQR